MTEQYFVECTYRHSHNGKTAWLVEQLSNKYNYIILKNEDALKAFKAVCEKAIMNANASFRGAGVGYTVHNILDKRLIDCPSFLLSISDSNGAFLNFALRRVERIVEASEMADEE